MTDSSPGRRRRQAGQGARHARNALLLLAAHVAACEFRRQEDPLVEEAPPPELVPQAPAGGDTADGLPAAVTHVNATHSEWFIALDADVVDAGLVTLSVANTGQYEHVLQIEPQWRTEPIPPGGTSFLEVRLEPGTYYLSCPVDDEHGPHHQLGERATLIVR